MENMSAWKTIKIGFLLGIGFIIPSLILCVLALGLTVNVMESSFENIESEIELDKDSFPNLRGNVEAIQLGEYTHSMQGTQLLIQGSLTNVSEGDLNSIEIEAELFDDEGTFVYECSEYINTKISPDQTENYQIKCGCSQNGLPDFTAIKLKVVRASNY